MAWLRITWITSLIAVGAITVQQTLSEEPTPADQQAHEQQAQKTQSEEVDPAAITEPEKCLVDKAAIEDIRKSREEIASKEKALESRESELKARETALNERLKKLQELRDEIAGLEGAQAAKNEEKVAKLVETFENMSPKVAAKIMASLNDDLAVTAMSRITTPKLAKILAAMDSQRSSHLSEIMAVGNKRKAKEILQEKGGEKNDGKNEQRANTTVPSSGVASAK